MYVAALEFAALLIGFSDIPSAPVCTGNSFPVIQDTHSHSIPDKWWETLSGSVQSWRDGLNSPALNTSGRLMF